MSHFYFSRKNQSRVESSSAIRDALSRDLIEITELEYILLGLVSTYPSSTFTAALSKAYNLLDRLDSELK